jgi:ATP-dependent protease ClpP protease subunit
VPSWADILLELRATGSSHDVVRRKYLAALSQQTGRNTIIYYSGWLQKTELTRQRFSGFEVNDSDKNGLMSAVHKMDRSKGLDLILHTPGGESAATESIVDYLRAMFGRDVRAIVPQLAMSAGTMIALSAQRILMGRHSSLGPIDPQVAGVPAHGVIEEFAKAAAEIAKDPSRVAVWQPIIAKYPPTFIGECQKAIAWTNTLVRDWLETGMFYRDKNKKDKAAKVVKELADHSVTLSHARHVPFDSVKALGIKVDLLEADQDLQDAVLSLHHATMQTLQDTGAIKIIENQYGTAFVQSVRQVATP